MKVAKGTMSGCAIELSVHFGSWEVVSMEGDAMISRTWFGDDMIRAVAYFSRLLDSDSQPIYLSVFDETA
jgi:hypothetical protein